MSEDEKIDNRLVHIADLCFAQFNNYGHKTRWSAVLDALSMAYDLGFKDGKKEGVR